MPEVSPVQAMNDTADVFQALATTKSVFSEWCWNEECDEDAAWKLYLQSIPAYGIFYAGVIVLQGGQPP